MRRSRKALLTVMAAAMVVATAGVASADTIDPRARSDYERQVEAALAQGHDELRAQVGVAPLTSWSDIRTVARGWSEVEATVKPCTNALCHNVNPNSSVPYFDEYGCHVRYGENVAWRSSSGTPPAPELLADLIMTQWRNSSGHLRTLQSPDFDEVGIGIHMLIADGSWQVWATVNFRDRDPNCTPNGTAVDPAADEATAAQSAPSGLPRLAGEDRIATAIAAAGSFDRAASVILASSADYPDALAAAPLAGALDAPVLLTASAELDARVAAEIRRLGADHVVLVGGTNALSSRVRTNAEQIDGVTSVERLAGPSRWDTAAVIANRVVAETGDSSTIILVEGANANPTRGWPDALAAASTAARTRTPILLTLAHRLPGPTARALHELDVETVLVVGGETAVQNTTMKAAASVADAQASRWAGVSRFATSIEVDKRSNLDSSAVLLATGLGWADALSAGPAAAHLDATLLLVHATDTEAAAITADWIESEHRGEDIVLVGGRSAISEPVASSLR